MGFQYNGKLRAPELLLRAPKGALAGGEPRVEVVRDREVVACLFSNARMPADLGAGLPAAYPYWGGGAGSGGGVRRWQAAALAAAALAALVALAVQRRG